MPADKKLTKCWHFFLNRKKTSCFLFGLSVKQPVAMKEQNQTKTIGD